MRASSRNRPAMTQGEKYVLVMVIAFALLMLFLPMLITKAFADGFEPGQPGYSSYKDQGSSYSNSYRHEPTAARKGHIKDYLTAEEKRILRKIHKKAVARRNGKVLPSAGKNLRKVKPVARYDDDEPAPIRYDRGRRSESLYVVSGRRECKSPIEAVGRERGTRKRALANAYESWNAEANARDGWKFNNVEKARGLAQDCGIIRTNKFGVKIWVCSILARPCRDF